MCLLIFFFLHYVWHTWIPSSNRQIIIFLGTWKSSTGPQQNKKKLSNNALHSRTEMVRKRKREHYEEEWKTMFRIYGYSLYFCNQVLVSSTGMQSYTNLHKSHLERASVSWKRALLWWELGFPGEHDKMCLQTPQTQVRQVAKALEKPSDLQINLTESSFSFSLHPFN